MCTMVVELYDALISAGADEAKARDASKAVAEHGARFAALQSKLVEHDGRFTLLQWVIGFNLAFTMATLWKVFSA